MRSSVARRRNCYVRGMVMMMVVIGGEGIAVYAELWWW